MKKLLLKKILKRKKATRIMTKKISEVLEGAKKVAISGHIRPDGDCIGSCLGLYNYICDNFKDIEATVFLENTGSGFEYLNGYESIKHEPTEDIYDLYISLDTSAIDRVGVIGQWYNHEHKTVCIDHHISNLGICKENYIEGGKSSCCEVLYDMFEMDKISKNTAEALYTGIVHDTGVFKYSSTTEATMVAAGRLMSKGIDQQRIIDNGFYAKSYKQNQILGRALLESILVLDGKCIFSAISKANMDFYGVESHELGGIVEQLRLTEGVECAIFIYEIAPLQYKVSLRSKEYIDVNEVAGYFGGGGHIRAAGCTMQGTTYDVINNIIRQIEKQL